MRLSDLTAYAERKYNIREQHTWSALPGISILSDPRTGNWIAMLLRRRDRKTGDQIESCDIRCGKENVPAERDACLSAPVWMHGKEWVGVRFGGSADPEPEQVFRLLDCALRPPEPADLSPEQDPEAPEQKTYRDTPLPLPDLRKAAECAAVPKPLQRMKRYYDYSGVPSRAACRSFYLQARCAEDYEDDVPWQGEFRKLYPRYQDLSLTQLRGYFTWRTAVRRGEYLPIPTSAAYLYVYELLNGIGAYSFEDRLAKLREFEHGFVDSGIGDPAMRRNLHRWMLELAVLGALPPEQIRSFADPQLLRWDESLAVLHRPGDFSDGEVFDALCTAGGSRVAVSPVIEKLGDEGRHLFAEVWRKAAAQHREDGKRLFTLCFGERKTRRWKPLDNALYYERETGNPVNCELDAVRSFCWNGRWWEKSYLRNCFDKKRLGGLLRETERQLREYVRAGRTLPEREEERWAAPYVRAVIEEDREAKREVEKPKVSIRFDELEQIRQDAALTRDSLMTEADLQEAEEQPEASPVCIPETVETETADQPLDAVQLELMRMLLRGESVRQHIAQRHAMATVVADGINEALFEQLGDSAVDCDGDDIRLVEDYREDIVRILGGIIS